MCLQEHLYHKNCTTTRQSWLFSFHIVVNNKQDEMKLENIYSKLQSSFILFTICTSICFTLHDIPFHFKIFSIAKSYLTFTFIFHTNQNIFLSYNLFRKQELSSNYFSFTIMYSLLFHY